MYPSTAVLLLLFGNAIVSAQTCIQLPDVPNAQLDDRKDAYQKGDNITFTCDVGYTSGRQIMYICLESGNWQPTHRGSCRLKPCVLPDDIPNGYFQIIEGDDFVFGTTLKYFCNDGYQMASKEDTRTCFTNGWSNHLPVCESLSCEPPPPVQGVTVEGLPIDDGPILPDRFLTFSCDATGSTPNGPETLVCGKDGKWDKPFPNCVEFACELPAQNDKVRFLGAEGGRVAAGNRVTVQCVKDGSSTQVECLSSGQWASTFPTCSDTCDVLLVPDSVLVSPRNVRQLRKGHQLQFRCKVGSHVLHGPQRVTCQEDGQWSQPFPSCTDPQSCGLPPPLDNGDFLATTTQFGHNSRVRYQCQDKYVMRGGPHRTCLNGVWTGEIICLKPCTINPDLMVPNKIKFKWGTKNKIYAPHGDGITFECTPGATHDGNGEMRQLCDDGEMMLPRCV